MGNLALQTVSATTLISSPTQAVTSEQQSLAQSRANLDTLYSINHHTASSPQFQISTRHVPDNMVRHISESLLRENMARENTLRENINREDIAHNMTRHLSDSGEARMQETLNRHHLVESPQLSTESLRRHITDGTVGQNSREVQEQQQTLPQGLTTVEAEGNIPVSRGLQLLSHGVLPGNLQFTALLNSDLVAIGEAVIRNQNGIPTMFQQKFGPPQ